MREEEKQEMTPSGSGGSLGGAENGLELVVIFVQPCEYSENHRVVHCKMVSFQYVNYISCRL